MTRRKIEIKRIDSVASRQATFSKRRRGLFNKARELSVLCDAEIALIVHSAAGKQFDYASSSIQEVLERYNLYSDIPELGHPTGELRTLSEVYNKARNEVAGKTSELRRLTGEDLQGCTYQELQKLEEVLGKGLTLVSEAKDQRIAKEISELKRKGVQLKQENWRLKQELNIANEQGQSSESVTICSSPDPPQANDSSDTTLKLGLPLLK